jgi:hypothetical protein
MKRLHPVPFLLAGLALLAAGSWPAADETAPVTVRVTESGSGRLLPCRLTVVDAAGEPAPMKPAKDPWLAYRPGVLYTGTGEARFNLRPGRYTLYANRGLEYGLVTRRLEITGGGANLNLQLPREVDTAGYISCDTHIHTLTHSGHGDSTIEERMATIAGEGIELAIATDHNHHTDYAPHARATRTHEHFTPVIGNEVTTKVGHFNAFPIRPGSRVPEWNLTEWEPLLAGIRATPGVRVVVLNHPSNDHSSYIPTDPRRFHPGSGESREGKDWAFDGIEVVTSAALQSDWMKPYRDWFALLNRGKRMAGIGSSDTHDVNRFILGQGRTYIASTATRPDQIDVQEACDSILAGKVLVSMGLLTEAWVDGRYGAGELASGGGERMKVRVRVQGPRWVSADRVDLFANGQKLLSRPITHRADAVVKLEATFMLPRPKHDVWLVAIASGPGVDAPYWPIPRPYQPVRADWDPAVIGSANAIRVDGDGDGRYSSPLDYARRIVEANPAPERLIAALARYDEAVAVQAASVCREKGMDLAAAPFNRALNDAAPVVRHGFVAYRNLLR